MNNTPRRTLPIDGDMFRKLAYSHNMTFAEIGRRIGVSRHQISRLAQPGIRNTCRKTADGIVRLFKKEAADLCPTKTADNLNRREKALVEMFMQLDIVDQSEIVILIKEKLDQQSD
ncbi:MAG: hypothetical protein JEZ07_20245 [Phycisphaerae bacterium]|nr:hypothetical protein [Phycisphaerae bacterium]